MNDNIRETGEDASVNTYLNLFGPIFGRGKTYLRYILGYYIRNDCQAGDADYEHFIVKAAADRNISPADIIIAINHYIRKSWVQFADAWKMYTAWTEETAPPAATAVRLLCEGFVPFTCSYGKAASILQTFSRKSAIRSIEKTHLPLVDVGQFTEFERDIIESNLLVNLDDDEVYAYAGYLSYRVERDLYPCSPLRVSIFPHIHNLRNNSNQKAGRMCRPAWMRICRGFCLSCSKHFFLFNYPYNPIQFDNNIEKGIKAYTLP